MGPRFGFLPPAVAAQRLAGARFRPEIVPDPALDQGLGELPDVEVGIERAAHALGHGHGLLQEHQLRLLLHRELLGHHQELAQKLAQRDLGQRQAQDRLADRPAGLLERLQVLVGRHVAGAEEHLGDAHIVAAEEAHQDLGQMAPGLEVEPAHDAEIERHDDALGIDQHVAGVHVGVEEAVAEHLVEEHGRGLGHDRVRIVAVRDQPRALVDGKARDALEGGDALGGAAPVDAGHAKALILGAVGGELGGSGRQAAGNERGTLSLSTSDVRESRSIWLMVEEVQ